MAKWGEIKCPRCEELEAKLAYQDGMVRAFVAAALMEAHDAIAEYPRVAPDEAEAQHYDEQIDHSQSIILALIPDGGGAWGRVVAESYRNGWRFAFNQFEKTGSVPDPDYAAAIRKGDNERSEEGE